MTTRESKHGMFLDGMLTVIILGVSFPVAIGLISLFWHVIALVPISSALKGVISLAGAIAIIFIAVYLVGSRIDQTGRRYNKSYNRGEYVEDFKRSRF